MLAKADREKALKGEPPAKWRPKYSEWDLHAQMLREIREAIYSRGDQIVAALGKRPKVVPVLPGPETEVDRAKARLDRQGQMEIIYLFAPHAIPKE